MTTDITTTFDYGTTPREIIVEIEQHVAIIQEINAVADFYKGRELKAIKNTICLYRNGGWNSFVPATFNKSREWADGLIRGYDFAVEREIDFRLLSQTVIGLLARETTPEAARSEIIGRAESGERMTVSKTQDRIGYFNQFAGDSSEMGDVADLVESLDTDTSQNEYHPIQVTSTTLSLPDKSSVIPVETKPSGERPQRDGPDMYSSSYRPGKHMVVSSAKEKKDLCEIHVQGVLNKYSRSIIVARWDEAQVQEVIDGLSIWLQRNAQDEE